MFFLYVLVFFLMVLSGFLMVVWIVFSFVKPKRYCSFFEDDEATLLSISEPERPLRRLLLVCRVLFFLFFGKAVNNCKPPTSSCYCLPDDSLCLFILRSCPFPGFQTHPSSISGKET